MFELSRILMSYALLQWPVLLIAVFLSVHPVAASAQTTPEETRFRLSGFGAVGVARTDTDDAAFTQPSRLDHVQEGLNLKLDTKLAVQGRYQFSDALSATVQLMSKYRAEGNFKPNAEWAFVKWDATEALSVRIGRLVAPVFMASDSRAVNYSQLMVRPPMDVYGLVPISTFDGSDLTYRFELGDASVEASVLAGRAKSKYANNNSGNPLLADFMLDGVVGFNVSVALDRGLTLRAGSVKARLNIDARSDRSQWPANVQAVLAGFFRPDNDIQFSGLGMSYDHAGWLMNAEYTLRQGDSYIPDAIAWYLNAGYRLGAFVPYIGYSRVKITDANRTNPYQAALGQPVPLAPVASEVQQLLNSFQASQQTATLGVRWDFTQKMAIKVQWDHIRKPANSFGWFYSPEGGQSMQAKQFFESTRNINLMSAAVDFVF